MAGKVTVMRIRICEFVEGAENATGVTVIIDVFRAFSVACYAFNAGASGIIPVGNPEDARLLQRKIKHSVLAGERDEKKIAGFDLGNSPTEIIQADLDGRYLIHATTAGTRGINSAKGASVILAAALVNVSATANYIKKLNPADVTLVAMGYRAEKTAEEDIICAEIISDRLKGGNADFTEKIKMLREGSGARFFKPGNIGFSPPSDFFLCTMTDRFDFALRAERRGDGFMELFRKE
ncbi:MAG: 2-phosphosulfolactate phosphatase [Bacteroidales bacterium]